MRITTKCEATKLISPEPEAGAVATKGKTKRKSKTTQPLPNSTVPDSESIPASALDDLVGLRTKMAVLEDAIKEVMPAAIDEALSVAADVEKRIVFENRQGKIILTMRKKLDPSAESVTRFDELIVAEQELLQKQNNDALVSLNAEIETLQQQLAEIQEQREILLSSARLKILEQKKKTALEETTTLTPSLAVYLK